ncbi:hypothetical protein DFH11DRAFT_1610543 [Phellopilus nigrolimitatus]|nr:hypothetical protein DFH11DRAFT_1610543 [Phellopilus nigrolimitatus]
MAGVRIFKCIYVAFFPVATLTSSTSSGRGKPSLSSGISEVDELNDDSELWRRSSEAPPASVELWHDAKMGERHNFSPSSRKIYIPSCRTSSLRED